MKNRSKKIKSILTKPFLIQEYVKNKKPITQIAKEMDYSSVTIWNYLVKFNIPRRTISEITIGKNNPNFGNHKLAGSNSPTFIDGRTLKEYYCKDCLKKGIKTKINWQTVLYGNGRCASCAGKGKRNSNYIDGRSKSFYPSEFNQKLKNKIRKRDNYQCQITEEEHLIVFGGVLDVHHIDYNKENCEDENLISVCKGCNLRANYNRQYWIKFYQKKMETNNV